MPRVATIAPLSAVDEAQQPDSESSKKPQKKYYRQRAHTNPLSDHCFDYPVSPDEWDYEKMYSEEAVREEGSTLRRVTFADIGCGYGGLLVNLSTVFPQNLALGMEIRVKVSDYVSDRIKALRLEQPGKYGNIACIRGNAMKHLPCFFAKGQLEKMFFLFPDPHFKKAKHKWRIINQTLLAEYAYVLKEDVGKIYIATDVEDLFEWMTGHLSKHPLFARLSEEDMESDPAVGLLFESTEEGQKVTRSGGNKWKAVFRRIPDAYGTNTENI